MSTVLEHIAECAAWFIEVDNLHNHVVFGGNNSAIYEWELQQGKAWIDLCNAVELLNS